MSKDEQHKKRLEQLRSNIADQIKADFSHISSDVLKTVLKRINQQKSIYVLENLSQRFSEVDTKSINFESSFDKLVDKLRFEGKQQDKERREQRQEQLKKRREQLSLELIARIEMRFPSLPKGVLKKNLLKNDYVLENLEHRLSELVDRNNSINLEDLIPILINRIRLEEIKEIYKIYQATESQSLTAKKLIESDRRIMNEFAVRTNVVTAFENYQKSSTIQKIYDSGRITCSGLYKERGTDIVELEKKLLKKAKPKLTIDQLESIWIQSKPMVEECDSVIRNAESQKRRYEQPLSLNDLEAERQKIEKTRYFDPRDIKVSRRKIIASIVQRQGQSKFRCELLKAYDNRCAITGCDSEHAIEAAHISPYNGPDTNHITNGLPLRADMHTLFDLHLLSIEPSTYEIKIASKLLTTCYRELDGRKLTLPKEKAEWPSPKSLQKHYESFSESETKEQ